MKLPQSDSAQNTSNIINKLGKRVSDQVILVVVISIVLSACAQTGMVTPIAPSPTAMTPTELQTPTHPATTTPTHTSEPTATVAEAPTKTLTDTPLPPVFGLNSIKEALDKLIDSDHNCEMLAGETTILCARTLIEFLPELNPKRIRIEAVFQGNVDPENALLQDLILLMSPAHAKEIWDWIIEVAQKPSKVNDRRQFGDILARLERDYGLLKLDFDDTR